MKLRIFEGYVDFFNFLESYSLLSAHEALVPFKAAYALINKGCGCAKAKRMKTVEDEYTKLASAPIPEDFLNKIKIAGQFSKIQMYVNGNLIFEG